jgi:hypothetical protein
LKGWLLKRKTPFADDEDEDDELDYKQTTFYSGRMWLISIMENYNNASGTFILGRIFIMSSLLSNKFNLINIKMVPICVMLSTANIRYTAKCNNNLSTHTVIQIQNI